MSGNIRHIINMANSIVGVSILSMPYCFKEAGLVLATVLVLFSGLLTKRTCMYLIRSAMMARRRSYELLAFQVFGVGGKLFMELCLICFLIGICISFHVVMGDLAPSIVANYMSIENSPSLRCTILCGIVLLVILPLCLLRNIDSLASMSACSIGFYVFLNSIVLYAALPRLLDGSWLSLVKLWEIKKAFHVLPIMSLAMSCQSNVFEIYDSLPDPDVTKMKSVVGQAVNLCCALYIGVGFLGYIAFADVGIGGNVIMSFPNSGLTDSIKLLFVISLAISFPLMLFPCRTSIHSLFYRSVSQVSYTDLVGNYMPEFRFRVITVVTLIFSLCLGILLPNIEFVLGLLGSTMGVLIAIILPSVFFIRVYTKTSADRIIAQALLLFGLLMMVTGTFIHIHSISNSNDIIAGKSPMQKLAEKSENIAPIISEKVENLVKNENPAIRKEPAIPEPPHIPIPESKVEVKKEEIVPKLDTILEKKVVPEIVVKEQESEALHPDAIKHEDKEKAVEEKGKEVIEQKQEKILNYIEEQQKNQIKMLEILHELKDKKANNEIPVKDTNFVVSSPSNLTAREILPQKLPDAPQIPKKIEELPKMVVEPEIKNEQNLLYKPISENKLNLSNVPNTNYMKPMENVKVSVIPLLLKKENEDQNTIQNGIQSQINKQIQVPKNSENNVPNKIQNKAPKESKGKHDEERKKRDLSQFEIINPKFDLNSNINAVQIEQKLKEVPIITIKSIEMSDLNNPEILEVNRIYEDVNSRRLLWSDVKIRRRKKHNNGDEYWDEI